ncbi:MAG: hypothetical protein OXM01_12145, partial [Gemmatimonadota bacterium]|nr:hypothetical protein [Gemmatimonadota bacterium]
ATSALHTGKAAKKGTRFNTPRPLFVLIPRKNRLLPTIPVGVDQSEDPQNSGGNGATDTAYRSKAK